MVSYGKLIMVMAVKCNSKRGLGLNVDSGCIGFEPDQTFESECKYRTQKGMCCNEKIKKMFESKIII
jgi:hypothetical protein